MVSVLCIPEVFSACNRLVREKLITTEQYSAIKHEFLLDIDSAVVVNLTEGIIEQSVACLEKGAIRSLDAIHVSSALVYGTDIFVTGDMRQKSVTELMGLAVEYC